MKEGNNIKKLKYEEVKIYIEILSYQLVSKEYINARTKLILKDNDGYYYYICLDKLKQGRTPSKFHILNPYTIQNIKLWCKLNNKSFELLSDTYKGDREYLEWKCLKSDCGEIFEMNWQIIHRGSGCPFCSGHRVGLSNCLATKNPELIKEWHPILNGDLTPYDITGKTNKYVWWKCSKNPKHEWYTSVNNRNIKGVGCPYCSGFYASEDYNLLMDNPKLCEEWDYDKNEKLPEEYTPYSIKSVYWKCQNNHKWRTSIRNRNFRGDKCPYCSGRKSSKDYNLQLANPELCKEWNYKRNDKNPEEYTPRSNEYVWWICEKGHEWFAVISNRNRNNGDGNGCPYCAGHYLSEDYNLLVINPELCKEWDYNKNDKRPEEYHPMSNEKVYWKCKDCSHEWKNQY